MKQIDQKYLSQDIRVIFITGIDAVFNEEDNIKEEIETFQLLMADTLRKIATKRSSNPLFVISSSNRLKVLCR